MEFLSRSTAGGNSSLGATSRCNLVRSLRQRGEDGEEPLCHWLSQTVSHPSSNSPCEVGKAWPIYHDILKVFVTIHGRSDHEYESCRQLFLVDQGRGALKWVFPVSP